MKTLQTPPENRRSPIPALAALLGATVLTVVQVTR